MNIYLNNQKFKIYQYDNDLSILERYSLTIENTLSVFFRIEENIEQLTDGMKLTVKYIVDEFIKKLTSSDLSNTKKIEHIKTLYPHVTNKLVGILFVIQNNKINSKEEVSNFKDNIKHAAQLHILDESFSNSISILSEVESFYTVLKKRRQDMKEKITLANKLYSDLDSISQPSLIKSQIAPPSFFLDDTTLIFDTVFPDKENTSALFIFDKLKTNPDVPFIMTSYNGRKYNKVYDTSSTYHPIIKTFSDDNQMLPFEIWMDVPIENKEIVFFLYSPLSIVSVTSGTMSENERYKLSNYVIVRWKLNNIFLSFRKEINATSISNKMKSFIDESFDNKIKYSISFPKQQSIRGRILYKNFFINRAIFLDLIFKNKQVSSFIFVDEKKKTSMLKPRLFAYFMQNFRKEIGSSMGMIFKITPHSSSSLNPGQFAMEIRITRASNILQVNSIINVLDKLFLIYQKNYQSIFDLYDNAITLFKKKSNVKKKTTKDSELGASSFNVSDEDDLDTRKIDKKTGIRAMLLKKANPSLFRRRYPDVCQRHEQPYIVKDEEEKEKIKEENDYSDYHFLKFEGLLYACGPREPDDKNDFHIWPGLKKNILKKNFLKKNAASEEDYFKKHPYVVCCNKVNQYTKPNSVLKEYIRETEDEDLVDMISATKDTTKRDRGKDYIISSMKSITKDRFGELPFNFQQLFSVIKLKKITKSNQKVYPILRKGIEISAHSFISCLEIVFNQKLPSSEQLSKIKKSFLKIINQQCIGKQQLANESKTDLLKIINSVDSYIDPLKFLYVAQQHYQCNIFLYNQQGEYVLPYFKNFLFEPDKKSKSIALIIYNVKNQNFPNQCELICQVDSSKQKINLVTFILEEMNPEFEDEKMESKVDFYDLFSYKYENYFLA